MTKMSTAQDNEKANTKSSDEGKPPMFDVTLLAAQIENLESTADKLSTANVALLYVAGAVAVLIAVHAFWSSRVNARLRNAQNDVIRAKDEQLARDLKDKDLQISNANDRASAADERAAKADERAGEANKEAGRANERAGELELQAQQLARQNLELRSSVANLETAAADAKAAQQRVETELAKQQERTALAERAVVELENDAIPLMIGYTTDPTAPNSIQPLKAFAGTKVRIITIDDRDMKNAALQLVGMLRHAGWEVEVGLAADESTIYDGVTVFEDSRLRLEGWTGTDGAITALIKILEVNKWPVHKRGSSMFTLPGTITIWIGKKPLSRYLFERRFPEAKADREEFERLEKRSREMMEEKLRELEKRQKP